MKKLIILILLFICSTAYAYRIGKPIPIQEINPNTLIELNNTISEIWDITNGRMNFNVVTSVPTGTTATEGDLRVYYSGSTYRLYFFVNGGWRYITFDG